MGMKPRVLLANEGGHGRGHLVTLRTVAEALGDGFDYDAALPGFDFAGELAPIGAEVYQGVKLTYDPALRKGPRPVLTSTWGEFLADLGFRNASVIRSSINWWRNTIIDRGIEVLVAEYAPMALLAAQTLKLQDYPITTIAAATGYGLPPSDMPKFPVLLPEFDQFLFDELDTLSTVNGVLAEYQVPALPGLPAIYRADHELARTIPMLDPYHAFRKNAVLPPVADRSMEIADRGSEVFIYFSTTEFKIPGLVEALCRLPLPMRGFLPGATPIQRSALKAAGVMVEERPVPVAEIARRSRMILHSGQHGIMCLSLFAGLAQVAVPQHLEQLYHARCGESAGVCKLIGFESRTADTIATTVATSYSDNALRKRALSLAETLRQQTPKDPEAVLRDKLASVRQSFGIIR